MKFTKLFIVILFLNLFSLSLYAQKDCPKINISGPSFITQSGEPMVFTANIENADEKYIKSYIWTVDNGTIIEGQGTSSIKVDTNGLSGQTITATLTLSLDDFLKDCGNTASEVGVITEMPKARLIERMQNPNCEYRQMIMDVFFTELNNDPNAMGYIFTFGSPRRVAEVERKIRANLKWRKFDSSRITFVNGGGRSKKPTIEFWLVPIGADIPTPEPPVEDEADFDTTEDKPEIKPDPKKPYIFSEEFYDGGACIDDVQGLDLEGYAKFLKENPKSRGNIVILMMTKTEFREKEKEILDFLKSKGIARKRLRTFHQKTFGGVELWILP